MPVFEEWRVADVCSRRVRVRVWNVASPRPTHQDSDNSRRNDVSQNRIGFRNATTASLYPYRRTLSCVPVSLLHIAIKLSHIDIVYRAEGTPQYVVIRMACAHGESV